MSKAFHARCAGAPEANALIALLSDAERTEVLGWQVPVDTVIAEGVVLDYESADKEMCLGLDKFGMYADPETETCLTAGHMDFGWVREVAGVRCAFVGDIKKEIWTTADGPDSLQLHAYAYAYAQKNDCDAYCTGLWIANAGEWLWATDWVRLGTPKADEVWDTIRYAALNKGEFSRGEHCRSCWDRLHCPEHVLAAVAAKTFLSPVAAGQVPTADRAAEMVLLIQAVEDVAKAAKEQLREWVRRGELRVQDPKTGKIWGPVKMPGKSSPDLDKLRLELGPRAERYVTKGAPYDQFRWLRGA